MGARAARRGVLTNEPLDAGGNDVMGAGMTGGGFRICWTAARYRL